MFLSIFLPPFPSLQKNKIFKKNSFLKAAKSMPHGDAAGREANPASQSFP